MMGLLHTEMAFLNVIGDWLENSGLTTMIQNTGVAKPGVAQSLLSGQSVVRTKYFHKFNVYTFHTLMPRKLITTRYLNIFLHRVMKWKHYILNSDIGLWHWNLS